MIKTIRQVLDHHLDAILAGDVEEVLKDYDESSIIFTPDGIVQGLANLRCLFENFLDGLPTGTLEQFEIIRHDIKDEGAYLLWRAGTVILLGTDTLVIQRGKITLQSFAIYTNN